MFKQIVRSEERNPLKVLTFQKETLKPTFVTARPGTKRRVGKPRTKWVETALEAIWQQIRETMPELRGAIMNLENPEHVKAIQQTANAAEKQPCNAKQRMNKNSEKKKTTQQESAEDKRIREEKCLYGDNYDALIAQGVLKRHGET